MRFKSIEQNNKGLFPHQVEAKANILNAWDTNDNIMLQMPTGTGKTFLFTSLLKDILCHYDNISQDLKILIIAHRTELIEQISKSLSKYGIGHGIIQGSTPQRLSARVQVASIQSVFSTRNESYIKNSSFNFIIIDEAHHSLAKSYKRLFATFPTAKKLGVTATPCRLKKESFEELFQKLIETPQISRFIKDGRLANFQYISVFPDSYLINLTKTITVSSTGDYVNHELDSAFNVGSIRSRLYDSYERFAKGKKGIIYAINKVHAANIAKLYSSHGVIAEAIDCDTPKQERERLIASFKSGIIKVLVNVEIFTEGFDCPDVSFIQLARPTKSLSLYLQQVGRGLRISPNKESTVIIDNVGLYYSFGLPDADRDWNYMFRGREVYFDDKRILRYAPIRKDPNLAEGDEEMVEIKDKNGDLLASIDASISYSYRYHECNGYSWESDHWKLSRLQAQYSYKDNANLLFSELILTIIRDVVNSDSVVKKEFFCAIEESKNRVRLNKVEIAPIIKRIEDIIREGKEESYFILDSDRIIDDNGCKWAITKDIPESIVKILFSRIRRRDVSSIDNVFSSNSSNTRFEWNISEDNLIKLLELYIKNKNVSEISKSIGKPERYVRHVLMSQKLYSIDSDSNSTAIELIERIKEKREKMILVKQQKEAEKLDQYIESFLIVPKTISKTLLYPFPTIYAKYKPIMELFAEKASVQMIVLMLVTIKMIENKEISYSVLPYSNNLALAFKHYWSRLFGSSRNAECRWSEAFCKLSKESFCRMALDSGSRVQANPTSLLNHGAKIRFCSDMDQLFCYGKVLIEFKKILLQKLLPEHSDRIQSFNQKYEE